MRHNSTKKQNGVMQKFVIRLQIQLYSRMPVTKKIVSFGDKYSTSSGRCSTDTHSSESEDEQPKSCL